MVLWPENACRPGQLGLCSAGSAMQAPWRLRLVVSLVACPLGRVIRSFFQLRPVFLLVICMYIHSIVYIYTLHTYIHTYIRTYIHTYIQTCMQKYRIAYIHNYIHTESVALQARVLTLSDFTPQAPALAQYHQGTTGPGP